MKLKSILLSLCLIVGLPSIILGNGRADGWCQDGNYQVSVPGGTGPSANRFQRSFPSCTITVYNAGTTDIATIYSDYAGTAKANPFTASGAGRWFFYAANGSYDIRMSGGGIPSPFTLGGVGVFDPARATGEVRDCFAPKFTGANMGARIVSCIADLPATGGTADARSFQGAGHTITASIDATAKPVRILLGASTISCSITQCFILGSGSSLEGSGRDNTFLVQTATGNQGILSGTKSAVRNLTLRGPCSVPCWSGSDPGSGSIAINSGNADEIIIEDAIIERWSVPINTGGNSGHWRIERVIVQDMFADGIFLPSVQDDGGFHTVRDNVIRRIGSNCIDLNSSGNLIEGNYLEDCGLNAAFGTDTNGILMSAQPLGVGLNANADKNVISGNQIYTAGVGIRVRAQLDMVGGTENHANDNKFINNHIDGSFIGIMIDASVDGSNPADTCGTANNTIIQGNTILNSTSATLAALSVGGGADFPNHCTIENTVVIGNTVLDSAGRGIWNFTPANNTIYVGNISRNNTVNNWESNMGASVNVTAFCNKFSDNSEDCTVDAGGISFDPVSFLRTSEIFDRVGGGNLLDIYHQTLRINTAGNPNISFTKTGGANVYEIASDGNSLFFRQDGVTLMIMDQTAKPVFPVGVAFGASNGIVILNPNSPVSCTGGGCTLSANATVTSGFITVPTGASPQTVVVDMTGQWNSAPVCSVNNQNLSSAQARWTTDINTLSITSNMSNGDVLTYMCLGSSK